MQALFAGETMPDPKITRSAVRALAAIGGPEAARTLVDLLVRFQDDRLKDSIVTALAGSKGSSEALAALVREARQEGNRDLTSAVIAVALRQGKDAGAELRQEVTQIVQNPESVAFELDETERLRLRASALGAAAAFGDVELVMSYVENNVDDMGRIALYSLRNARGDEAALKIAKAAESTSNERDKREYVVAIGETGSRAAVPALIRLLEDPSDNVRNAAASALVKLGDRRAVAPILKLIDDAKNSHAFNQHLIDALGTALDKKALPKLEQLRDSENPRWQVLSPYVRRAISRIESGNAASMRLK